MLDEINQTIPSDPGSYFLWLHLSQPRALWVGKLGQFPFPEGDYVYLGSARGPGGLRSRLGRHLRGNGKPHWHIDYLRAAAKLRGFGYTIHRKGTKYRAPTECDLSQKFAALPEAKIVAPCFGASDCQSGCTAHMVYFPNFDTTQITNQLNSEVQFVSLE